MWRDALHFWRKTPARSLTLLVGCALVMALLAVNTHLFRNSLWFVPPGTHAGLNFVTLGTTSAEGRFSTASAADLRTLDHLGFQNRYTLYSPDKQDARLEGQAWKQLDVAFVSDGFFPLLGIGMAAGVPFGPERTGVVLDHGFWASRLGADPRVVGKSIQIQDTSLPILGVAHADFRGLGTRQPAIWVSTRLRAQFLEIAVPGMPAADLANLKATLVEQMPAYHALVALKDASERSYLEGWKVRTTEKVAVSGQGSGGQMSVGFNRRDFKPAILKGIDLVPEETQAIGRHLWLLSGLSLIMALLAIMNLGSYWTARTSERAQEIQVHHAVGAQLPDLVRLFAGEALPFLGLIVALAWPLAWGQLALIQSLEPFRTYLAGRSGWVGFQDFLPSLVVLFVVGILAVAAPLLNVFQNALRSRSLGPSAATQRWRLGLMVTQWVLVVGAGLLAGASVLAAQRMQVVGWGGSGNPALVRLPFSEQQQTVLAALQVDGTSAPLVEVEPLGILARKFDAFIPAHQPQGRPLVVYENQWSPTAVTQLGVPLQAGRLYEAGSQREVMISASMARAFQASPESLLNRPLVQVDSDGKELPARLIVGVLADVHYNDLRTPPELVVYAPPEPDKKGLTLLMPETQRASMVGILKDLASRNPEVAETLGAVTTMSTRRDEGARTETVLSLATFGYALLALTLLLLGILAEARMQLGQRGRELALVVSLGARLEAAVFRFMRLPLLVVAGSLAGMMTVATVTRHRWLSPFPMLGPTDLGAISAMVVGISLAFSAVLLVMAVRRLRSLSLADLMRVER